MNREGDLDALVSDYCSKQKTDLFLYSGGIQVKGSERFIKCVGESLSKQPRATLFLATFGGDLHSAYRMIRCLKDSYSEIVFLVNGLCKSSGTLIAIGSTELAFGRTGELGPLDVQMVKPDEILPVSSGLDTFQGLAVLTSHAFKTFEKYMLEITSASDGSISTRTASHIASQLVTGLLNPIAAQIDPIRLGEAQRALAIATEYGKRLASENLKPGALEHLVEGYPAHGFVIDQQEAARLFEKVRSLDDAEKRLAGVLGPVTKYPSRVTVATHFGPKEREGLTHEKAASGSDQSAGTPNT